MAVPAMPNAADEANGSMRHPRPGCLEPRYCGGRWRLGVAAHFEAEACVHASHPSDTGMPSADTDLQSRSAVSQTPDTLMVTKQASSSLLIGCTKVQGPCTAARLPACTAAERAAQRHSIKPASVCGIDGRCMHGAESVQAGVALRASSVLIAGLAVLN